MSIALFCDHVDLLYYIIIAHYIRVTRFRGFLLCETYNFTAAYNNNIIYYVGKFIIPSVSEFFVLCEWFRVSE